MLGVITLSVIRLNVVAPLVCNDFIEENLAKKNKYFFSSKGVILQQ
jgi:hypothetical protein